MERLEMNKLLLSTTKSSLMARNTIYSMRNLPHLPCCQTRDKYLLNPSANNTANDLKKIVARNCNRREIYPINMNTLVSNQL